MIAAREKRPSANSPHGPGKPWQLRLYVAGQTSKSLSAYSNLTTLCECHLKGRYRITVIDLLEQPQIAKRDQVLATPKVVRWYPTPRRTVIGTLSDAARVLDGLSVTQDP